MHIPICPAVETRKANERNITSYWDETTETMEHISFWWHGIHHSNCVAWFIPYDSLEQAEGTMDIELTATTVEYMMNHQSDEIEHIGNKLWWYPTNTIHVLDMTNRCQSFIIINNDQIQRCFDQIWIYPTCTGGCLKRGPQVITKKNVISQWKNHEKVSWIWSPLPRSLWPFVHTLLWGVPTIATYIDMF